MSQSIFHELKQRRDQVVTLHCTDGEVILARIEFISDEEEDCIFQMLATNRLEKPAYAKAGIGGNYLIRLEDIKSLETDH